MPPQHPRSWPVWMPAVLAVGLLTGNMLLQSVLFGLTDDLYLTVGLAAVATLLAARAAGGLYGLPFSTLALLRPIPPAVAGLAVLAAAGALMPASLLTGLSTALRPPPPAWLEFLNAHLPATPAERAAAWVAVTVAAPLAEEVLFRGLLYRSLRAAWAPWPVAVLTALLFALSHGEPWAMFGLIALGLLYARLTELTGSILPAVLAHAVHNGLSFALMLHEGGMTLPAADAATPWGALAASLAVLGAALALLARRPRR
ncbi:MAG TPA: CPBP family intramembrane metalloprotease [Candidatus Krumholzibacteria bacterium]|nr:CPBP family intramembrane metalloprotease [Candidatus Krumholzibacteria bacterium]HRX50862.1 CPBP family intramembrane metalloprotease [Candidatus Krumholzibacteria bacterium]